MSVAAEIKMQFSAPNTVIGKAGVSGSHCSLIQTNFSKPIVKAIFNTHAKYQPNWLLGRRVFPWKQSLAQRRGPAVVGRTARG